MIRRMTQTQGHDLDGILARVRADLAGLWPPPRVMPPVRSYTRQAAAPGAAGYRRVPRVPADPGAAEGPERKRCSRCRMLLPAGQFWRVRAGEDTLQSECRSCMGERAASWRIANRDRVRRQQQRWRNATRDAVFDHYGRVCACPGCGATDDLTIDHIAGGGTRHRQEQAGMWLYRWIVVNGFPAGLQTMCRACNLAKSRNAACPLDHERTGEHDGSRAPEAAPDAAGDPAAGQLHVVQSGSGRGVHGVRAAAVRVARGG